MSKEEHMTDTNPERILGSLRIFQAIHNDLELKHEIVTLEDGTKTWAYTYEGIDPYELEDKAFPTILKAFSQHEQEARYDELKKANTFKAGETPSNNVVAWHVAEQLSHLKEQLSPTQEKRQG